MPSYTAPIQDYQFLIQHFLPLAKYADMPGFADAAELTTPLLEEGARFCQEVLFPLNLPADAEGCHWKDGTVTMPKGFKEAYDAYVQGGWPGFTCKPEYGGQGLPEYLYTPLLELICSANLSFGLTPGLSHGAYNALVSHASDELKQKYLPKLVEGTWSGVMDLTEPQCGTDLGLVRTTAEPQEDGSYRLNGNKIFISSGEQDLTENILHLVLARLPDAPAGIKGISLFLVPKFLVNDDGSLGERNGVTCTGIEEKMGIHASPTCAISFENATGWLVGVPHKGMRAMFTMMNTARLYVGMQGLGIAEVAYQNAVDYALERRQGRSLKGPQEPGKPADLLVVHPDIRRTLLTMKAFNEGARALSVHTALKIDISERHPDPEVRAEADEYVQLMTPVIKAHFTDGGSEMANHAMQVFGGYGYIREYGAEQYVRDARIAQIYEGTNGIQALDLVGRKLGMHNGRLLRRFFHPLEELIGQVEGNEMLAPMAKGLRKHMEYLQQATLWIAKSGMANPEDGAAAAVEYLRMFGMVAIGEMWLRMAVIAATRKAAGDTDPILDSKLATARFYLQRILPQSVGLLASLTQGSKPIMDTDPAMFTLR